MPTMERGTILIVVGELQGDANYRPVTTATIESAEIYGTMAVHSKPIISDDFALIGFGDDYVITHLPTGYRMTGELTHEAASLIARTWANIPGVAELTTYEGWHDADAAPIVAAMDEVARAIRLAELARGA